MSASILSEFVFSPIVLLIIWSGKVGNCILIPTEWTPSDRNCIPHEAFKKHDLIFLKNIVSANHYFFNTINKGKLSICVTIIISEIFDYQQLSRWSELNSLIINLPLVIVSKKLFGLHLLSKFTNGIK